MPLRDHFHSPVSDWTSWDSLHGQWPAMIVMDLNNRLPPGYVASPRVRLGTSFEIDVAASSHGEPVLPAPEAHAAPGAVATAVWTAPQPTLAVATELPEQDEYEVLVFATEFRRLVAAVEIVSPANKDRPEHRRALVAKCATLLQQGVAVSIVDLVTSRRFNLYADLLELIGQSDPSLAAAPSPLYAVTCRWRNAGRSGRLETWAHEMAVGEPLPVLPLWLNADLAVPLDLEATYEDSCRILRIR